MRIPLCLVFDIHINSIYEGSNTKNEALSVHRMKSSFLCNRPNSLLDFFDLVGL